MQNTRPLSDTDVGYRTYEVYQRERVGESTPLIKPRQLRAWPFLDDPYPVLAILREHYPCYRDLVGQRLLDHPLRRRDVGLPGRRQLRSRSKLWTTGCRTSAATSATTSPCSPPTPRGSTSRRLRSPSSSSAGSTAGEGDLSIDLALRFSLELLARVLDLPDGDVPSFAARYVAMQRGVHTDPVGRQAGRQAIEELVEYFRPLVESRRATPGADLVSAIAALALDGDPATAEDVVATLLEADHETLPGALANLWFLLLTHPDQLDEVLAERQLVKLAYLEAMRHSPPVLAAQRYARHEVERFGRLLPTGALVVCSAAAANRDPRAFADPTSSSCAARTSVSGAAGPVPGRRVVLGHRRRLGPASIHPAVPEDRPRSGSTHSPATPW